MQGIPSRLAVTEHMLLPVCTATELAWQLWHPCVLAAVQLLPCLPVLLLWC